MALCYFKMASCPTPEDFLSDKRLADTLLDYIVDPNFHAFFHYANQNPALVRKLYRYLILSLAAMDSKLGYLVDEKVPIELVFAEKDLMDVKKSEFGRIVIDKLSKVKGVKVRKQFIFIANILLDNLALQ